MKNLIYSHKKDTCVSQSTSQYDYLKKNSGIALLLESYLDKVWLDNWILGGDVEFSYSSYSNRLTIYFRV